MNITIKNDTTSPLTKVTYIDDGKNTLTITTDKRSLIHTTSLQFTGDSIHPIVDLLKILEAVG